MARIHSLVLAAILSLAALRRAQEFKGGDIRSTNHGRGRRPRRARRWAISSSTITAPRLTGLSAVRRCRRPCPVHEMSLDNGICRMRRNCDRSGDSGNGEIALSPKGYHVMFTEKAKQPPLEKRANVKAALTFEHAGSIAVGFQVGGVGRHEPGRRESRGPDEGMKIERPNGASPPPCGGGGVGGPLPFEKNHRAALR